jgi:hypothetical protein
MHKYFLIGLNFLSSGSSAETSGDWQVNLGDKYAEAFTASDSGGTFGLICDRAKATCFYYVTMPASCDEDASVPLLANADAGSLLLTGRCAVINDAGKVTHVLALSPFDDVTKGIQKGQRFGLAVPMVDGQFRVFRFSLNGSSYALSKVNSAASRATGDQSL